MVIEQVPTLVRMIFHLDQSNESFRIRATGSHFHVDTVPSVPDKHVPCIGEGGGQPILGLHFRVCRYF